MHILRIEHAVGDFDGWKEVFDSDPLGRATSGVAGYRVLRPVGDRNYVQIDLEFVELEKAEAFLAKLHDLWARVDVMYDPTAQIVEVVDSGQY